jgi:hypothetical protein
MAMQRQHQYSVPPRPMKSREKDQAAFLAMLAFSLPFRHLIHPKHSPSHQLAD